MTTFAAGFIKTRGCSHEAYLMIGRVGNQVEAGVEVVQLFYEQWWLFFEQRSRTAMRRGNSLLRITFYEIDGIRYPSLRFLCESICVPSILSTSGGNVTALWVVCPARER